MFACVKTTCKTFANLDVGLFSQVRSRIRRLPLSRLHTLWPSHGRIAEASCCLTVCAWLFCTAHVCSTHALRPHCKLRFGRSSAHVA